MLITLNLSSSIPIYQQLKERIIEGLASGLIAPGEALPSVRRLASDLSINLHTVNKAYNQLKADGFISVHRNRGAVVNQFASFVADEAYQERLQDTLRPVVAEALCRGLSIDQFLSVSKEVAKSLQGDSHEK